MQGGAQTLVSSPAPWAIPNKVHNLWPVGLRTYQQLMIQLPSPAGILDPPLPGPGPELCSCGFFFHKQKPPRPYPHFPKPGPIPPSSKDVPQPLQQREKCACLSPKAYRLSAWVTRFNTFSLKHKNRRRKAPVSWCGWRMFPYN